MTMTKEALKKVSNKILGFTSVECLKVVQIQSSELDKSASSSQESVCLFQGDAHRIQEKPKSKASIDVGCGIQSD